MTSVDRQGFGIAARRFGYAIAIAINAVLLWIAMNLLEWGWFDWLTDSYEQLIPLIVVVFSAEILKNIVFVFNDAQPIKSVGELLTGVLGLILAVRTLQVYPLDFSAYDFNWDLVARIILIVGVVGSAIGLIVEFGRLLRSPGQSG